MKVSSDTLWTMEHYSSNLLFHAKHGKGVAALLQIISSAQRIAHYVHVTIKKNQDNAS